ncbi:hypothetical protein [Nioella nitratireducens]|uniref:hypothetical protein n=1 Tax=Nioella nitratireducens TaxID=1287720 RepID=UPI0008FD9424|nr:hypothetical protein [Nioella nitratireducens]
MADAAKSDDIEDVLSSIRRLVSENQPVARPTMPEAAEDAAPAAPTDESASDKLILTQALRVTDPEDPWRTISPRAEGPEPGHDPAAPAPVFGTGDTIDATETPSVEDAHGAPRDHEESTSEWEHEIWGDGPVSVDDADPQLLADQWEDGDLTPPAEASDPGDALEAPLDVTEAVFGGPQDDGATSDGQDDTDLPPLSFIRSTSSVSAYEPEDDNDAINEDDLPSATLDLAEVRSARDVGTETPVREDSNAQRVKVQILRPVPDSAQEPDADAPPEAQPEVDETAEVDPLEALETVVTEFSGSPDPADPADWSDLASGSEAAETTAASDGAQVFGASPDFEDLGSDSPFTFPDESDGFVDEDTLREIIAEVVREELQGEMGVRITRNIRKLVRREIRLALSAQDLD